MSALTDDELKALGQAAGLKLVERLKFLDAVAKIPKVYRVYHSQLKYGGVSASTLNTRGIYLFLRDNCSASRQHLSLTLSLSHSLTLFSQSLAYLNSHHVLPHPS